VKRAGLRQTILLWFAHWLKERVERFLAEQGDVARESRVQDVVEERPEELQALSPADDDALVDWIDRVREGAPELLAGVERRWPAAYRKAMARRSTARRPEPSAAVSSTTGAGTPASGAVQAASSTPAGQSASLASKDVSGPAPARGEPLPPPAPLAPPAPTATLQPSGRVAAPLPRAAQPPGALRWSERVRRRAEEQSFRPHRQAHRPIPRAEVKPPEPAEGPDPVQQVERPRGEPPPRWPAAHGPTLELPQGEAAAAGRWPELPPEEAPAESEDGLARRLERRRRIEHEQRGD
jgi:hypothetical protein